jgi:cell shape-determining protein MreC
LFYRFKSIRKMKKLVFMFVAVAAISFASCGNKAQAPVEEAVDSIAEVVDSVVDSLAADSVVADSVVAE